LNLLAKLFGGADTSAPAEGSDEVKIVIDNREPMEYVIVRRSETPEPVYTESDVDSVDSPWLKECGVVRVWSKDPGGGVSYRAEESDFDG
jgi:hypothetical protein